MVFQGLKHNALEEPPLAGSGLPLPSALEPPRSETAKLPSSLGKVFNKLFQQKKTKTKTGATTRLPLAFLVEGY